jgi:hypothetical protein
LINVTDVSLFLSEELSDSFGVDERKKNNCMIVSQFHVATIDDFSTDQSII